jgi:hypothetical protein
MKVSKPKAGSPTKIKPNPPAKANGAENLGHLKRGQVLEASDGL